MVMDLLRSCSVQSMRYVQGDPSTVELGWWYFAKSSALPFPVPHRFGSPVWDTVHPTPTSLGFNAEAVRAYYRGTPLNSSDGTRFAGRLEDFVKGAEGAAALPRGSNWTPRECLLPPFGIMSGGESSDAGLAVGGLLSGGICEVAYPPGVACAYCSGSTPSMLKVTLSGFSGSYAAYSATHLVPQTASPCIWKLLLGGTLSITVQRSAGAVWTVVLTASPLACFYAGTSSDCVSLATLSLIGSSIGGDPTCTIEEA